MEEITIKSTPDPRLVYKTLVHKLSGEFGVIADLGEGNELYTSQVPVLFPYKIQYVFLQEQSGLDLSDYTLKEVVIKIK
jgi:hypothetical protein